MAMPIFVVVYYAFTALKVIPVQEVAAISNAVILKPPENQYILKNEDATLLCKVQGAEQAYWVINRNATNHHQPYYEELGVTFIESKYSEFINLTMTVPACLTSKVNNIQCFAADRSHRGVWSNKVGINVLESFRPFPPITTIDVVHHYMGLPQLYVTVNGEPLWPDYEISGFKVNITDAGSGSLLDHVIVTNNSTFGNNIVRVQINKSLLMFTTDEYYSLTISVSAVSPLYSEGKPYQSTLSVFRIQNGDASLYKVALGISLGIALVLLLAFSVLLLCFCVYYRRRRQQGNHSPNQAHSINRCMVTNPTYDCGQVYDTIDHQFGSRNNVSRAQTTSRYSSSPNHNTFSLDTTPRKCTHETLQMANPCINLSSSGVPSPLSYDKSQEDTCLSVHAGCYKSEESQYVEMKQSGTISQQVIQPVIVM